MATKPLKVYGWRGFRQECPPARNGSRQTREIMAAASVAEVLRATGISRSEFNHSGSETGNDIELDLALSAPGVIYWKPLHAPDSPEAWTGNGQPVTADSEPMTWTRRRLSVPRHAEKEPAATALLAAIDAVLALHPASCTESGEVCNYGENCPLLVCDPCGETYPCPTRRAITDATRNLP